MDMQMPDMDGLTATRVIQQEWSPLIRPTIVALTANALPGDRERYLENGLDDYLGKPIRLNDLIELLRSVHSKRQSPAPDALSGRERHESIAVRIYTSQNLYQHWYTMSSIWYNRQPAIHK